MSHVEVCNYPLLVTSVQGISSVVYIIRKDILNVLGQMTRGSHQIESDCSIISIDQIGHSQPTRAHHFCIKSATVPLPP